ncbi:MAG: LysR substrate-binding domain-containing protein [Vitreoscilla sp.]
MNGPLVVNDFPTMLGAALAGVGLAQLPRPIAASELHERRLEEVLSECAFASPGVFLYHSGRRQVLPKLRAFIDHVQQQAVSLGSQAN